MSCYLIYQRWVLLKKYSFSQRQLFTLLAAKNHDNMSAVHIAIHHNHHKTVETYYAAINVISQSLSFSADELKTLSLIHI